MDELSRAVELDHKLRFRPDLLGPVEPLHWRQLIALDNLFMGAIDAAARAGRRDITIRLQAEFDRRRAAGLKPPHQQS